MSCLPLFLLILVVEGRAGAGGTFDSTKLFEPRPVAAEKMVAVAALQQTGD
jgi:hypothetical protein